MSKIKGLFTGFYGYKNTGDDLFVLLASYAAKKYWKNSNFSILSANGPIVDGVEIKYAIQSEQGRLKALVQKYLTILRANYVILAGGSILHSKPKIGSYRWLLYLLMRSHILKVSAIGVSLGPFKTSNDYEDIKKIISNFQFLVLRDKESYALANRMELPFTPVMGADLAFILPELLKDINLQLLPRKKNTIGVSVCHFERYYSGDMDNEKRRELAIFEVLNDLKNKKDIFFKFFVINGHDKKGDEKYTHELIHQLELQKDAYEIIPYSVNTLSTVQEISECSFIFSVRLHAAIIAAALDIPSILIEYHRKCTDYLDDMGINDQWRVGDIQIEKTLILDKIDHILNSHMDEFYPKRLEKIGQAFTNFDIKEDLA